MKEILKGKYIRIVMRDLAGNVMADVGLRDTMSSRSTNPTGDSTDDARSTHKDTIMSGKGTTREGEGGSGIMGKCRVGVLEEGDEDEPVVNPKVRHQVDTEGVEEAESLDAQGNTDEPDSNTNIGLDDAAVLMGSKQRSLGDEV